MSAAYPSYLNVCTYGPPALHWRAAGLPPMLPELPLAALRHVRDLRPLYYPPCRSSMGSCRNASTQRFAAAASPLLHPLHRRDPLVALVRSARMHPFAMALSGVSSRSQVDHLSLVSRLSLSVCYNTRRPCVLQVFARAKDLAWLRHPSQLIADRSALLLAFQPQPFAMNLIRGIDPDSYLLGGWQLGPGGLRAPSRALS